MLGECFLLAIDQCEDDHAGRKVLWLCPYLDTASAMQTDSKGAIAAIGTTLEIESHSILEDGRMGIDTIGGQVPVNGSFHDVACKACTSRVYKREQLLVSCS